MDIKPLNSLLIVLVFLLLNSCEQKEVIELESNFSSKSLKELYKDSCFLKIEGDLNDPELIWRNIGVYAIACERMHRCLKFERGKLNWFLEGAENLKISQNIYDYIINAWNYDNKTLQDTNYKLVPMGIYYRIEFKFSNIEPKTKTAQIILDGMRDNNMRICCDIMRNQPTGYLNNYIDLNASEGWEPDNFMGSRIYNSWNEGSYYFSYCISMVPQNPLYSQVHYIATYTSNGNMESACNVQHAPLVTVKGRYDWEIRHGRF